MNIEISEIANLPTKHGAFKAQVFKESGKDHLLIRTERLDCPAPLVRVHSECLTGDALFSRKCDCGEQLDMAMKLIAKEGCGAILYLRQEGRNIGLFNKINAYALQDKGLDTIEANHQLGFADDERSYEIAEYILKFLGLKRIRLLTNNPNKIESLKGVEIVKREPLIIEANPHNVNYLRVKKEKSGHLL
ncbi:MAG: GTP cyclohydrolase II [Helicobacteraceae bacterium]|jgi:GTP cyclohydrolase II|nr:GTP cyclohydrolase II [Helicobacteraceae bacterium]